MKEVNVPYSIIHIHVHVHTCLHYAFPIKVLFSSGECQHMLIEPLQVISPTQRTGSMLDRCMRLIEDEGHFIWRERFL